MTDAGPRRRLGRYELIAEIASGGMGIVCLARSVGVGGFRRLFAIKVMHPHLVRDQQFVGMLLDEAQLAARIHHPNVVATVDICTVDDCYFVVMDYIDGFQLLQVLEHPQLGRHDRIRVVNRVLLDAMAGLEAAHTLKGDDGAPINLVHRDVSPQNILIGTDGIGRLTDFGIALAASRISSSRPGTIKGKPSYMAPEQARAAQVDRRADVWALGVILWEALSGQRLFVGDTEAATVLKVIDSPIDSPRTHAPDIPPALEAVCMRALERDATRRFASARQMAAELERAASSNGLLADSHEVADTIQAIFATEIEKRRLAIKAHAAAIGPNSMNMGARDIYELPQLIDDLPSDITVNVSPLPQQSGGHAPTKLSATPVEPTEVAPTPLPARAAPARTGPSGTVAGATREVPTARPARGRGLLIAVLVVAAASVAAWLLLGRSPAHDAESAVAATPSETAVAATPSETAVPSPVTEATTSTTPAVEVAPAPSAELAVEAPAGPASAASSAAPAAAPVAAGVAKRPAASHAKPKAPAPTKSDPAPGPAPKGPVVVEENPYGLR